MKFYIISLLFNIGVVAVLPAPSDSPLGTADKGSSTIEVVLADDTTEQTMPELVASKPEEKKEQTTEVMKEIPNHVTTPNREVTQQETKSVTNNTPKANTAGNGGGLVGVKGGEGHNPNPNVTSTKYGGLGTEEKSNVGSTSEKTIVSDNKTKDPEPKPKPTKVEISKPKENTDICRQGKDFTVSYNKNLTSSGGGERGRGGKPSTVNVKLSFSKGGGVNILSVSGGDGDAQSKARSAAQGIKVSVKNPDSYKCTASIRYNVN